MAEQLSPELAFKIAEIFAVTGSQHRNCSRTEGTKLYKTVE